MRWITGAALSLMAVLAPPLAAQEKAAPDYPPLPELVAERFSDGRFEPGDFDYLKGFFPEASEAEKAQYAQLTKWLAECEEQGRARLDAELEELGVSLELSTYTSAQASVCRQVVRGEQFQGRFATHADLKAASKEARLVFATLVETIRLTEQRVQPLESDFARELEVRPVGEQLIRLSFRWTRVPNDDPRLPHLSEDAAAVFNALVLGEMGRVDRENTAWLKARIEENDGWPSISQVGEKAADMAWLLVQHADHDPAFQLKALRLMEPLAAQGDVSKGNYAYLYDRIMLKLTGKQRFGSQITCKDGERAPHTLEEPDRIDDLRAEMGLDPISDYLKLFGECSTS
ncbi:MAG: DUF6624 domain-containing protein [Pseudomonadota bacterium]